MQTGIEKIIGEWKKGIFQPVYWLEGEEGYFIDQLTDHAEHKILSAEVASFNLTIFYGREASWSDVINACRRYPMFAERQVVLLKEAQFMKEFEKLDSYIENPLSSTVFVVAFKDKKVDGRSKFAGLLKKKTELVSTKKIPDHQLQDWTNHLINDKGYTISPKALALMVDHLGNDLGRISNETDKLIVNLKNRREIIEEDVEKFIGISREFNVFELQNAISKKDLTKAIRIIEYFRQNPKAGPIQLLLPSLFSFFSKVYMLFGLSENEDRNLSSAIGVAPYFLKDYKYAATVFSLKGTEEILLLLNEYNLKSVGVNDTGTDDSSLMKELVVRIIDSRY
ncbi:MAG: DNA polymerase III subunit delta [Chitinophagaceae bacterium]